MTVPRAAPLLLGLLGACSATTRGTGGPQAAPTELPVHRLYEGDPLPLSEVAVLLLVTPTGRTGVSVVGRITNEPLGIDFRPKPRRGLAELKPGLYRLELYFRIGRSQIAETPGGGRKLRIRSLRSAEKVDAVVSVEAGGTYFIDPELHRTRYITEEERSRCFPLFYSEDIGPDRTPAPEELEETDEFVWRPRLKRLSEEEAQRYRSYR